MISPNTQLQELRHAMISMRQMQIDMTIFCQRWRNQTTLLAALPSRYTDVAENLLVRLESGSLFTEESCSFSQQDLLDNLNHWISQAEQQLALSAKTAAAQAQP